MNAEVENLSVGNRGYKIQFYWKHLSVVNAKQKTSVRLKKVKLSKDPQASTQETYTHKVMRSKI